MKNGGTVVFDTRDALMARPGGPPTPEALWLRALLEGVDVPELEPVPRDHVLTKTFYLLDRIVGRTDDRRRPGSRRCRRPIPMTATRGPREPETACRRSSSPPTISPPPGRATPMGGRSIRSFREAPRQRELAFRSGINLVMYTLTGNYKADQVHAKDIIERLTH